MGLRNGLKKQFWPLQCGFLTPVHFFSNSRNGLISRFWILKVLCDVYPKIQSPTKDQKILNTASRRMYQTEMQRDNSAGLRMVFYGVTLSSHSILTSEKL